MGGSLTQRRRVREEALRGVNLFGRGEVGDSTRLKSHG